jgi:hypothetical protein
MLIQEVSEIDRLLIISELEQVIQSLVTDQSINVEFDVEDNGNEKVLTITTNITLPGIVEEAAPEEEEESGDNGGGGGDEDPEPDPNPPEEPEPVPEPPVEPEPPGEIIPAPPFG